MKFRSILFISFSILILQGLPSCGGDPKEDAKSHLETIRFDVFEPADDAVSKQNDAIGKFMTSIKNKETFDWSLVVGEIIDLRSVAEQEVDKALVKLKSVPASAGKTDLKQATINYLTKIAEFESDIEPSLSGLKNGMDLVSMMQFSEQLRKAQELEVVSQAYETAQKGFMKEHEISTLDVIKMEAERL